MRFFSEIAVDFYELISTRFREYKNISYLVFSFDFPLKFHIQGRGRGVPRSAERVSRHSPGGALVQTVEHVRDQTVLRGVLLRARVDEPDGRGAQGDPVI